MTRPAPKPEREPTREQTFAYSLAFDYFNRVLFDSALDAVVLNFSRHARSLGFFAPDRWSRAQSDGAAATAHEISLNPDALYVRDPRQTMSTLVHEMTHLWQQQHGAPSRRGHHNRQWADKMIALGLHPSHTGMPGGRETGQRMTHYIVDGGPFDRAFLKMPSAALLPWRSGLPTEGAEPVKKKDPSKVKHTCPSCGAKVWGKRGIRVSCLDCEEEMLPPKEDGDEENSAH